MAAETEGFCHASETQFPGGLLPAPVLCRRGRLFGGYAILARCGVLASAQTMNLLEMVMDALHGKGGSALLHLLCLVIYFLGTMSTVLLPHLFHVDMRRLCPAVDALAAVAVGFSRRICR